MSADISFIPSSSRLMSISFVSGSVTGKEKIEGNMRQAMSTGLYLATTKAHKQDIKPTVAKDTGALRRRVGIKLAQAALKAGRKGRYKITMTFDSVLLNLFKSRYYAKYHIRESADFKFVGGYKRPTTPGTKPISGKAIMRFIKRRIQREISRELRKRGLWVR